MQDSYNEEKDTRKKTVVIAIIIILLCIASIVSITWALFTSGGDDGKIGINVTTGKVQVDIVDTEQNSLIGDVLDFANPNGEGKLYFEPGASYYTQGFQVKNVGSVPVNFRVYISDDENVDKEEFAEAFELYITTDPTAPQAAEKLTSFSGRLEVEQSSGTYYLVVKMKETAGNRFQNKTYTGIGITVYAVQGNVDAEE